MNTHWDVIVIGAGMSGLGAGIRLAMAGKKVLLLEKHYSVGGLNGFYVKDKILYDVGLHAMTNFVPAGSRGHPLTKLPSAAHPVRSFQIGTTATIAHSIPQYRADL